MSEEKKLKFVCREITETKVADEIHVGMKFRCGTMFGTAEFEVVKIDREKGTADTRSGRTGGYLERREDGWYDQHTHFNLDGVLKVTFV